MSSQLFFREMENGGTYNMLIKTERSSVMFEIKGSERLLR